MSNIKLYVEISLDISPLSVIFLLILPTIFNFKDIIDN